MSKYNLRGCSIVAAADRAPCVDQAVQDLAEYTGGDIVDSAGGATGRTLVLVGRQMARTVEIPHIGLDGLSDQGFVLETVSHGGAGFVICSGGGSRGDAYAVIELIKAMERAGDDLLLDETSRREEPFFVRRGMYAHQHWAYAHPYALRTWTFDHWRAYVDLLAYMKINLFCIWSMAGILPNPLSQADRAYLENYHRVIDYAKNRRGMEVFIGECANNVAETDGGVPVQQRHYFDVEVLKDPSDAAQLQDIMDNRRNLYEVASNADGYWIIDSDPGGFEGSPESEFVDIMVGNRELIDRHTDKGRNARLAYWMWMGWGMGRPMDERQRIVARTTELMRDRLREPWVLFACWPTHLDAACDLGYIDKSIFFPYSIIEDEPSPPTTRLRFDEMYRQLSDAISTWGIRGAMGNAQTPLVQLPNIFFFAEMAWNGLPPEEPPASEIVSLLARLIAPEIAEELADGWLALSDRNAGSAFACAAKLETMAKAGAPRPGVLGMCYFPGVERLVSDLALQVRTHGEAMRLCDTLAAGAPEEQIREALLSYYDAALTWHATHDFRRYHCYGPDLQEIAAQWADHRNRAPVSPGLVEDLKRKLAGIGHEQWFIEGYVALLGSG